MKKKIKNIFLILLTISTVFLVLPKFKGIIVLAQYNGLPVQHYTPENGLVPDKETAQKIAEVVWLKVYGEKIEKEKPFKVKYDDRYKVWIVNGSLPKASEGTLVVGGTAGIIIQKSDGKILEVWHGK